MTPEEQTFHDNWQKEFLKLQEVVLFGAIGHNPKTFKQYTPWNVTGLVQRFKQRKRILGVSSIYRNMIVIVICLVSMPLAWFFMPQGILGSNPVLPGWQSAQDILDHYTPWYQYPNYMGWENSVKIICRSLVSLFFTFLPAGMMKWTVFNRYGRKTEQEILWLWLQLGISLFGILPVLVSGIGLVIPLFILIKNVIGTWAVVAICYFLLCFSHELSNSYYYD